MFKCINGIYILQCFVLEARLGLCGNTLTIQIDLYVVFIYFICILLHHLGIFLLHENEFCKVKDSYIKSAHYSICDDDSVIADNI